MKIIGLTGQTGAGKSVVSELFKKRGFEVVDADLAAREVVAAGSDCLKEIENEFSDFVINKDGTLDRAALAQIVFSNVEDLETLNRIIFPFIIQNIKEKLFELKKQGIKLTPKQEMELMPLFSEKAKELLDLSKTIEKLENELDNVVYELYGLTEDEIKIVEEGSK